MIIAMMGDAGAGKDTVSDHLNFKYGFRKHTIADLLYAELAAAYGVSVDFLSDRQNKDSEFFELSLVHCRDRAFVAYLLGQGFSMGQKLSPRILLQRWGDYRRKDDAYYFLSPVLQAIRGNRWFNHVVSDVRSELEYSELGKLGALYWRVSRPEIKKAADHHTETALAKARVDVRLPNNGTLCQLYDMVDALLFNEELMTA